MIILEAPGESARVPSAPEPPAAGWGHGAQAGFKVGGISIKPTQSGSPRVVERGALEPECAKDAWPPALQAVGTSALYCLS